MKRKVSDVSGVSTHIPQAGIGGGMSENQIVVYQPDDTMHLDVRLENETVWLTQAQLCVLFQRDVSVISRHIKNIFAEGELDKESNLHFLQIANADRPVAFYSLDVIISVGYRVKSIVGTRFRQWANKEIYLIGASLKDLGAKCFAFTKLDSGAIRGIKKSAFTPTLGTKN